MNEEKTSVYDKWNIFVVSNTGGHAVYTLTGLFY